MKQIAKNHNLKLREGVYCGLGRYSFKYLFIWLIGFSGGPCYETIAEINMLRILGGDAVGKKNISK